MKNKISILIISFLAIIFIVYPLLGQAANVGYLKVLDTTETGVRLEAHASCGSSPGCTDWGFEWGTSPAFPGDYTKSSVSSGGGPVQDQFAFYKAITNLSPGTTYYFRASAKDENGWGYSSERSFTTAASSSPPPCEYHNVWGWAWSENIGWISFSCRNTKAEGTGIDYGVNIDPATGIFSGYAWSENIGWISFEPIDVNVADCPDWPASCQAVVDLETALVSGWARAGMVEEKLYESYVIDYNVYSLWGDSLSGLKWQGQTFTVGADGPNEKHKVNRISLLLYNTSVSTEKTLVVSIRPSTSDNTDLCIGTKTMAPGSGGYIYEWYDIFLEDAVEGGCILSPDTQYLIAARCPDCGSFAIRWGSYAGSSYTGGRDYKSDDGGISWGISSSYPPDDFRFKIWGMPPGGVLVSGGWDGWIKLRGTVQSDGSPYGVYLDSSGYQSLGYSEFREWAWGGDDTDEEAVIGWISFNDENFNGLPGPFDYQVMTDIAANQPPDQPINTGESFGYCGGLTQVNTRTTLTLNWSAFSDPDGDSQKAYEVEINTTPAFNHVANVGSSVYSVDAKNGDDDGNWTSFFAWGTTYDWRVRVQDNNGSWSKWSAYDSFTMPSHQAPNPSFTPDPTIPPTEVEVIFTDGSKCYTPAGGDYDCYTESAGVNVTYNWDFGDGSPIDTTEGNTTHIYSETGEYTVRLEVTDDTGMCLYEYPLTAKLPLPIWKEITPF